MILVNGKKILFILSCVTISILLFSTTIPLETIQTSSTPVSNHVVVLDAGHGSPDRSEPNQMMVLTNQTLI